MMKVFFNKLSLVIYFLIAALVVLNINKDVSVSSTKNKKDANFILIGQDEGSKDSPGRGDALIFVNIKHSKKEINLISIPRDSLVSIPCGPNGEIIHKIGHAYSYGEVNWKGSGGGGVCTATTVANLFDTPPISYVISTFNAFKEVVDKVGGIEVVPKYSFCESNVCFKKGVKTKLDGKKALTYVRHRKSLPNGDITRTSNQRQVLVALFDKGNKMPNNEKMLMAFFILTKIRTNVSILEIKDYASPTYKDYKINSLVLTGSDYYIDGGYYYKLNKSHLNQIKKIING